MGIERRGSSRRAVGAAVVVAAITCSPAGQGRLAARGGATTLAPAEADESELHGKLEVLLAGPRGDVAGQPEISVSFSQPMKELDEAGSDPNVGGLVPFKVEPEIAGRFKWMGSRTVRLAPDEPIAQATEFRVTVPAGLESLTGGRLEESHAFTFRTPPPEVVATEPGPGERWAGPDTRIVLYFNQAVDPAAVESAARLAVGGEEVGFAVGRREEGDDKSVTVTPAESLPLDAEVEFVVREGLEGAEGPRPMADSHGLGFRTYGPLAVEGARCWGDDETTPGLECDPGDRLTVELTNPVPTAGLEELVRATPPPGDLRFGGWTSHTRFLDVSAGPYWAPGADHVVMLSDTLTDEFGQTLAGEREIRFSVNDFPPRWTLKFDGTVLEADQSRVLPVSVLNVDGLEVWLLRVDREQDVVPFLSRLRGAGSAWVQDDEDAVVRDLAYEKATNRTVRAGIDLSDAGGAPRGGLVFVRVQNPADARDYSTRTIRVSDMGITAKVSGDRVVAWVTELSTGEAVGGAAVTIRDRHNQVLWTGTTDDSGVAAVDGAELWDDWYALDWKDRRVTVLASRGDDFTYVDVDGADGISSWSFDIPGDPEAGRRTLTGLVFTDRGAYRPGETVRVKAIARVREKGRLRSPAGERVTVRVEDARGEEVLEREVTAGEFGGVHLDVEVGHGAPLGRYAIRVTASDEEELGVGALHGSFRVEEYRPPTFRVEVEPEHDEVTRGEPARIAAAGEYLFGAPMRGAEVTWRATAHRSWFRPPGWDGYGFGDGSRHGGSMWDDTAAVPAHSGQGELDEQGRLAFDFGTDLDNTGGPVDFQVEASVTGPDLTRVSGRARVRVHPADVYAGIRLDETLLAAHDSASARVVVVDRRGRTVTGRPVELTLLRRQWKYVKSEGLYEDDYGTWEMHDVPMGSRKVVSGEEPVPVTFEVPAAGRFVVRATTADAGGRRTSSTASLWAWGSGAVTWRGADDLVVEMHPDRDAYEVGDEARILVENPFEEAEALVTVEHWGIRDVHRRRFTDRAATIEIPITEDMRPNAFVSVALVRGRNKPPPKKGGEDPGRPCVRMGYASLRVGVEDRRLGVDVQTPRSVYGPGDEVEVDVTVTDAAGQGRQAEVTLFVVDEAVLMLTGYRAPDPLAHFYRPQTLGVANGDVRRSILVRRAFGTDKGDVGGGGSEAPPTQVRRDFRTTALFVPDLVTDAQGRARASFELPDGLTSYRVMAVAASRDDRFGRGSSSLRVDKPLMLQGALPRFVRVGDRFEAGVVVHDGGTKSAEATVRVRAEGVEVVGDDSRTVALAPGGSAAVRFSFAAREPGEAAFTFTARAGDHEDALELSRPVRLPVVVETVATYGDTTGDAFEAVGVLDGVREDAGGLDVKLSSTALVGLDRAVESLIRYPFGCAEQLTSRLVPMLALGDVLETFPLGVEMDEERLAHTVARLQQMQDPGGGWGYFSGGTPSPWLSAYVLWGLEMARRDGAEVDARVVDGAVDYLGCVLRDESRCSGAGPWWWTDVGLATKTYVLWVLASIGRPEPSYNDHLYDRRADLPLFSRLLLAHAIHLADGDPAQVEELMRDALGGVKQTPSSAHLTEDLGDGYRHVMHSHVRSTAMALRVLLDVDPDHALVSRMARWLMEARREDGTWGSTQNDAWVLIALSRYLEVREAETPAFEASVLLGSERILEARFEGRDPDEREASVSMAELLGAGPGPLSFHKDGDGRLYYAASLSYARDALPDAPLERGFFVEREYRPLDGGGPALVEAGGDVLVTLTVVVTGRRHFVAVEDPLPAGLEPVNLSLKTSSHAHAELLEATNGPSWSQPFYHVELHDDRVLLFADTLQPGIHRYSYLAHAVTPGTFVVEPARAHEMYQPEVYGRTAAEEVVVEP